MVIDKLLVFFVSACIFVGDVVLRVVMLPFLLLELLIRIIRKTSVLLLENFFKALAVGVWQFFKRPKHRKKALFSVSYYLFFYRIKYFVLGFLIATILFFVKTSIDFIGTLPNPALVENYHASLSTHIYDRNGKQLYEIYREQNRTPVKLTELPSYVMQATIAIEDKNFYKHPGVSIVGGIGRAIVEMAMHKRLQGGSTITQQLVKSALLSSSRTIERKVKEIVLALLVERKYSKQQILEMYLNQVPYGGTAWGIQEASLLYFGIDAKHLSLAQAALLAGLPQAPSDYSPFSNPQAATNRQRAVLTQMYQEHYITKAQYDAARSTRLTFRRPSSTILAPHFVFYVKDQLESMYGIKSVQEGGFRVYTTLDYKIQLLVEKILKEEMAKLQDLSVGNGAVLVTQPSTGEILAMVGSKDFFDGQYGAFNVTTALRQPGSSVKPITYTLGLEKGLTAASLIQDTPTNFALQGATPYSPVNYDGKFHGIVPLRYALANSYNIPAVKVLQQVGVGSFIDFAARMGITNWQTDRERYGLSLTLGGGEVTMIEMATAYGTIRNLGVRHTLDPLLKIEDPVGQVLYQHTSEGERVTSAGEPFIISDILADNVARGWAFGPNSVLNFGNGIVSVKTGTTDEKKDNWTIGYTRPTTNERQDDVLVTVWVGNNDNQPMNQALTSGITGAAPIWRRVMEKLVNTDLLKESLYVPQTVEKKNCYFGRAEYFVAGTSSTINCSGYKPSPTQVQ
ncbi:MAG: PBP1A family penicillin-binding protein [Patescibacteria group bacterium]|jgi:1A family penicillin-binding protein